MTWEYEPVENPDWDYARNLQTILKTVNATWAQSVFSANHQGFLAPNRDYPYQGLTALINGENWKFLDAVYFKTNKTLQPKKVLVNPWEVIYVYEGQAKAKLRYYLFEEKNNHAHAKISFSANKKIDWTIKPLTDIRILPGYEDKPPRKKQGWNSIVKNGLLVSNQGKKIWLNAPGKAKAYEEHLEYNYKLGSGWRERTEQGIKFKKEIYQPVFAGEINVKSKNFDLNIACGEKINKKMPEEKKHELPTTGFSLGNEKKDKLLSARLYGLKKFDVMINNTRIPSAGDYWFKKVYFRDTFEGLYNNINLFLKNDEGKEYVKKILLLADKSKDPLTCRIPNIYPSSMSASDASFLFYMVAGKYVTKTKDKKLAQKLIKTLKKFIESTKAKPFVNGPPVLENGLLLSVPWHPWVDSRRSLYFDWKRIPLIPTRVPVEWLKQVYEETKNPKRVYYESNSPHYLLPEVNAQWIRALEAGEKLCEVAGEKNCFSGLKKKASEEYSTLMNKDFPYNIIWKEKKDCTLTSMGMVSLILLQNRVFNKKDLKKAWPKIKKIMVYRKNKPFGVLVKNTERKPYLDENEYHETVVWPRDVPYLTKYLVALNKKKMARQLLLNHLDHQMSEGAIFYNHELFSLAEGKNPCPKSNDPVPVKNPVQYWSQFVEPFTYVF